MSGDRGRTNTTKHAARYSESFDSKLRLIPSLGMIVIKGHPAEHGRRGSKASRSSASH